MFEESLDMTLNCASLILNFEMNRSIRIAYGDGIYEFHKKKNLIYDNRKRSCTRPVYFWVFFAMDYSFLCVEKMLESIAFCELGEKISG